VTHPPCPFSLSPEIDKVVLYEGVREGWVGRERGDWEGGGGAGGEMGKRREG